MKKTKVLKKLEVKKATVVNLEKDELKSVRGGIWTVPYWTCFKCPN